MTIYPNPSSVCRALFEGQSRTVASTRGGDASRALYLALTLHAMRGKIQFDARARPILLV